jgi:hypothetical protein
MRGLAIVFAVMLGATACRKGPPLHPAELPPAVVWVHAGTNGTQYDIQRTLLSYETLDAVLKYASDCFPNPHLVICLDPGLSFTNAVPVLTSAENHHITNVIMKLNQIREPPDIGEPFGTNLIRCPGGPLSADVTIGRLQPSARGDGKPAPQP